MALLKVPSIGTERFSWTPESRTFSAEASDFGRDFRPSSLYDDACDIGFELVSQWTGKRTTWCLTDEIRDGEGELQAWEFKPTSEALRVNHTLLGAKVVIFND